MDLLQELYDDYDHSEEAETALMETNKELMDFLESNVTNSEKMKFIETIDSIIKCRQKYFFQAGFNASKELILK